MATLLDRPRTTEKLEADLRRQIMSAGLKRGDRILPERELCREYRLSRGAVQRVLARLTRDGLIERSGRHGTTVRADADSLRKAGLVQHTIVFTFFSSLECPDVTALPYTRDIYLGIESEALRSGWELAVQLGESFNRRVTAKEDDRGHWADGIVVAGSGMETAIAGLKQAAIPFVVVDYPTRIQGINCIYPDNTAGGYLAAGHLLDEGHRRIGFVYPAFGDERGMQEGFKTRFYGYHDALRERKTSVAGRLVAGVHTGPGFKLTVRGERQLRKYLSQPGRPTAVFVASDTIVPEFYRVAAEMKIGIPRDISVVGFEGLAFGGTMDPALTTVLVDREKMGRLAVHRLESIFAGETDPISHVLPVKLVVRRSTREQTK